VGQKTVSFSDLSGELITEDDALARIVIHEHPELGGAPVEIEVLADEARAVEKAAVQVAVVDLYLPGADEPRRVAMDVDAFDALATDRAMSELLISARPARRSVKTRRGAGQDQKQDEKPSQRRGSGGAPAAAAQAAVSAVPENAVDAVDAEDAADQTASGW
jgi:hypothetical protein